MLYSAFASQAATNWLLVAITALYCFFTYKIVQRNGEMVSQMRTQYEGFIAPVVTITIVFKHSVFAYLKIRNKGNSAAKNLRLNLDRDFYRAGEFKEEKKHSKFFDVSKDYSLLRAGRGTVCVT